MEFKWLWKRLGITESGLKLLARAAGVKMTRVRWGRKVMWRRFSVKELERLLAHHYFLRGNKVLTGIRIRDQLLR